MSPQVIPSVRLDRVLDAPPEEVFDAWLDAEVLAQFMCPFNVRRADVTVDARVGGAFSICMVTPDGEVAHTGEYVALERPTKLVFTWRSEHTDDLETLVTVRLTPDGGRTRLVLTHERLPDDEARNGHEKGWGSIVALLGDYLRSMRSADDYRLVLPLEASPARVFEAVTTQAGVAAWWTPDCAVGARPGDALEVRFPEADFFARFRIARLVPDALVEWECVDSLHPAAAGYANRRDWVGTKVRFELAPAGDGTTLTFTHEGLRPALECNATCRDGWWHYLLQGLRPYVEEVTPPCQAP
jgi:uncharacterized protein YndB with AHSA1/START domain